MKVNIIHDKELDSVKPLDLPIKKTVMIQNMMMWSEKTGQVTCYVIVYDRHTQYKCVQEKNQKTYTNYFSNYQALELHYKVITR